MLQEFESLSNLEIVNLRYPQIAFLIRMASKQEKEFSFNNDKSEDFFLKVQEKNPRLVFLIGVDSGQCLLSIEKWLIERPEVDLLIFEEDLQALSIFINIVEVRKFLMHPKIHLRYVLGHAELKEALIEAVKEYPAERIVMHLLPRYAEKYIESELFLEVFRKATLSSSLFHEQAYYHLLFHNLISNFTQLHRCFYADALKGQFKGIPAIICGAGPSLSAQTSLLKNLKNRALIIAGGSTITALTTQGVEPHIGFALDPNPEEYDRLKASEDAEIPILFASRLQPDIIKMMKGPFGYMRTRSGGFVEQALEQALGLDLDPLQQGLSEEGLSVTVMCLAASIHFGCYPIFLCGIDLAYVDGKRYADGVLVDSTVDLEALLKGASVANELTIQKNREGKSVYTTVKWMMEAATIEKFTLDHGNIAVFDCIEKGLGFKSLEKLSLAKGAQLYLTKEYDLKNHIDCAIRNCPHFKERAETIGLFLQELKESLQRCQSLIQDILVKIEKYNDFSKNLAEDSVITLDEMDLGEEKAFQWLIEPLQDQIEYLLGKENSLFSFDDNIERFHMQQLAFLEKKWKHYEYLIQSYLKRF